MSGTFGLLGINLVERTDKWKTLLDRFDVPIEHSPGVNLLREPDLYARAIDRGDLVDAPLRKPGYVGLALAHMRAWERVARQDRPYLVLEDDAAPREGWRRHVAELIAFLPADFDMLNVNVLRPSGRAIGNGLLRFDGTRAWADAARGREPNIWLSSYVITPHGASRLLELMRRAKYDFNDVQFDKALMMAMRTHADAGIRLYVVSATNRYFVHDESDSDKTSLNHSSAAPSSWLLGAAVLLIVLLAVVRGRASPR